MPELSTTDLVARIEAIRSVILTTTAPQMDILERIETANRKNELLREVMNGFSTLHREWIVEAVLAGKVSIDDLLLFA